MAPAETRALPTTEEVARGYFEAVAARDPEAMASFWADEGIDHLHGIAELHGPRGVRDWFANLFRAVPDMRFEVLDLVAEGDKAAVRWRASGTFDGTARWEGMEPNGSRLEMEGIDMLTVRDGLVRDNQAHTNGAEMARQLGALPPAGSAAERAMLAALNLKTRIARRARRRQSG